MLNPFDDRPSRIKAKIALTYVVLIPANVAAWLWAWFLFAGHPALLGTALLAYMFGLRHAFDADHIAAIDNVVRKLMQDGKSPHSAGFFFSLGHSSIVVLASVVIAATAAAMPLETIHGLGGGIGPSVSRRTRQSSASRRTGRVPLEALGCQGVRRQGDRRQA